MAMFNVMYFTVPTPHPAARACSHQLLGSGLIMAAIHEWFWIFAYLLNAAGLCQAIFATGSIFYIADYEACLVCFASAVPQEPAAPKTSA